MYFSEEFSLAPCDGKGKKEVTELHFQKRNNPQFSEEGNWLASLASANRVVIRDTETLNIKGVFPTKEKPTTTTTTTTTTTQKGGPQTNKENAPSSRSIPPPSSRSSIPSSRGSLSSRSSVSSSRTSSVSSRSSSIPSSRSASARPVGGKAGEKGGEKGVVDTKMGKVDEYEISPDEQFLLLISYTDNKCQVWSIEDKKLICIMDEHNLGITHARWTPDSRHVMIVSEFNLRTTVYSLLSGGAIFLPGPKYSSTGYLFVEDDSCYAALERENYKDVIALYRCDTWDIITKFECQTDDAVSIHSALNDTAFVIIDTRLTYKLKIFDFEGNDLGSYSAYSDALGIRSLSFDDRGQQYAAIGSHDSVLRILHLRTTTCVSSLTHSRSSLLSSLHVYRLNTCAASPSRRAPPTAPPSTPSRYKTVGKTPGRRGVGGVKGRGLETPRGSKYSSSRGVAPPPSPSPSFCSSMVEDVEGGKEELFLVVDGAKEREALHIKSIALDPTNPNHVEGVKFCEWSNCGGYIATVVESYPQIIWVWEVTSFTLHSTIILSKRVKNLTWHPSLALLLSLTTSLSLYLWSPHHCSCVEIPEDEERKEKEQEKEQERRRVGGGVMGGAEERSVVGMGFCESGESVWVSGRRGKKYFFCVLFVRPQELDFLQEDKVGEGEGEVGEGMGSDEEFDETLFNDSMFN